MAASRRGFLKGLLGAGIGVTAIAAMPDIAKAEPVEAAKKNNITSKIDTSKPNNPAIGELWFDDINHNFYYYGGKQGWIEMSEPS